MKIIDLLNKIADGEEVPKEIKYNACLFAFERQSQDYYCEEYGNLFEYLINEHRTGEFLNDEVEIIEEEETKPSEEEIEAFKEQFNHVWNSIMAVLGGILEALIKIDEQEVVKKVLEKETNNIEKLNTYNKYTSHNNLHTYMQLVDDKDGKEKTFYISEVQKEIINKVNELIDIINDLKGDTNEK